LLKNAHVS